MTRAIPGVRVAIDRGGTFCDIWAHIPVHLVPQGDSPYLRTANFVPNAQDGSVQVTFKLLSVDPANYDDAPSEGIRRLLEYVHGKDVRKDQTYDTSIIESVRVGTTIATNALLERKGAKFGLVVTKGFRDLLEIGDQTRPDLFDLSLAGKAGVLYDPADVVEAEERVTPEAWNLNPIPVSPQELVDKAAEVDEPGEVVLGLSGDAVRVMKPLDTAHITQQLQMLYDRGLRSLAVVLLHSYVYPVHEQQIAQIAATIGFQHVSLSSDLSSNIKAVSRGNSSAVDAYLSPVLRSYVDGFNSHFTDGKAGKRTDFMKSDGGLIASSKFTGLRAVLSGPAGGFVGCALTAYSPKRGRPVIGFDMGGTSTDVSRFSGDFELTFESVVANIKMACPQLAIETVAAGGGSRLQFKNGMFVVGPESVGSHPGPACYRKGGELAITDANLVLGRLVPEFFPSIFGPSANEPLDPAASYAKFEALTSEINAQQPASAKPFTLEEVAIGFLTVANEGMARPMRQLTEQRGHAISSHDLCCFGGAGGQHACAIAASLGIETVIVPRFSSLLSAYGIACAEITEESAVPLTRTITDKFDSSATYQEFIVRIAELENSVRNKLADQGVSGDDIVFKTTISVQYDGADSVFHLPLSPTLRADFEKVHLQETSFSMPRKVVASGIRVQGSGKSFQISPADYAPDLDRLLSSATLPPTAPIKHQKTVFSVVGQVRTVDTPVYSLATLSAGTTIQGPALIVDSTQTIVVEPASKGYILPDHVVLDVAVDAPSSGDIDGEIITDPIMLSVFAHRFMSIAEQMGHTLQRTSISVSIKERLDFSCSIHGADGALVANAPHIPIHLGSMQYAVVAQHEHWKGRLRPGDVLLTNHPEWGGTHLPDLTVVTPIFHPEDDSRILFYVASRGHHTDIGGNGVTSMNPISKELWQEGMCVGTFKLVSGGHFDEEGVIALFQKAGEYPGTSATRRIDHNLTDLQAAVSANARGSNLVQRLFKQFGTRQVLHYMKEVQIVARETIREFFRKTYDQFAGKPMRVVDMMDDGTEIVLEVRIDRELGEATFDWTGTGPQQHGNFNMPPSLTHAAIIYALRCMISSETPLPLNQGVMDPVKVISPKGTYINPIGIVAISGSTVGTHRLIDNILRAFEAAACSQGCANATGFGAGGTDANGKVQPGFTYGESMGGGTGAGPSWSGRHATHVHCTNTRLPDPEVVEYRTPLLLKQLSIRRGSGGRGKFNGGDGMDRLFQARMPVNCSIVSQRRVLPPLGMKGGENGKRGVNTWCRRKDGAEGEDASAFDLVNLGNNAYVQLRKGDMLRVQTPGGGGWGTPDM